MVSGVFAVVWGGLFELSSYEIYKKYCKTDSDSFGQLRDHSQTSTQRPTSCGTDSVHTITQTLLT